MSDLLERVARAGRRVDPQWTAADVARTLPRLEGLGRRRRLRRWRRLLGGLAVVALVGIGVRGWQRGARPEGSLAFEDGSRATALDPQTALHIVRQSATEVAAELERGRARFEVKSDPARHFRVHAGDVEVAVLGTIFTVERVADRVGVTVERGRVAVAWSGGTRTLAPAQSGWFPPLGSEAGTTVDGARPRGEDGGDRSATAVALGPAGEPAGEPAQRRATTNDHPSASASASATPRPAAPPSRRRVASAEPPPAGEPTAGPARGEPTTAGWLLEAADDARLAHDPERAALLLERLLAAHPHDPRAQLAAFTLGRVLLGELTRPQEAAQAFARARALAPTGPLAEDALAREAEAWSRAPAPERARATAQEYLRLYPTGHRRAAVEALAAPAP